MRILFVAGLACAACALVQCTPRKFNAGSDVKGTGDTASMEKDPATGTQVNPKAFNAYNIWRDGKGTEILDYPAGYFVPEAYPAGHPDGVFYVEGYSYWKRIPDWGVPKFIGSVTEGAKVEGDLLTYPTKEGRSLALKFSAPAEIGMEYMTLRGAVQYCKAKGLRLPHIQELFDFCAAGTAKNSEGTYRDNRCQEKWWWSASLGSTYDSGPWQFKGDYGYVNTGLRSLGHGVRCVSGE